MDPLTLSTSFATIVGLICNFKQENKKNKNLNTQEFVKWLEYHHHDELKEAISENQELAQEINKVLREDHELIISKLNKIDSILAGLASNFNEVKGLVHVLNPYSQISEQAISILKQFVHSGSDEFFKDDSFGGSSLNLSPSGPIEIEDERFLNDDLNTLVEFGFLHLRFSSSGTEFYGITRNAVCFIEALELNNSI